MIQVYFHGNAIQYLLERTDRKEIVAIKVECLYECLEDADPLLC